MAHSTKQIKTKRTPRKLFAERIMEKYVKYMIKKVWCKSKGRFVCNDSRNDSFERKVKRILEEFCIKIKRKLICEVI